MRRVIYASIIVFLLFALSVGSVEAVSSTVDSISLTKSSYRQGEIVAFNYWVTNIHAGTDHVEVYVSLVDPSGFVVQQLSGFAIKINGTHYIYSGSFSLSDDAATGTWTINGTSKSYSKTGRIIAEGSASVQFTVVSKPAQQPIIVPVNGDIVLPSTVYMMPDGRIDPFTIAFFVVNASNNLAMSNIFYDVLITDPLNRTVVYYCGFSGNNGEVCIEGDTDILATFGAYIVTVKLRNSTLHTIDSCTDILWFLSVTFPRSTYITERDESRRIATTLVSGKNYYVHINVSYLDPDRGILPVSGHLQFRKTGGEGVVNVSVYFSFMVSDEESEVWAIFQMPYGNFPDGTYQVVCATPYGFQVDFGTYEIDWEPTPEPVREIFIYPKVETSVITPFIAYVLPTLTLLLGIIIGILMLRLFFERRRVF